MPATISRVTSFGATRAGDQHGADDEIRVRDGSLRLEPRRHQQRDPALQDLLEMAHAVERALEDRHLGAEAERDDRGVVADDAAADDHDLAARDAGHAAEQQPAPAERLLEEVRAGLRREPARDLRHRREQRQRAVRQLDGLVGDGRDARVDERPRERLVGRDVQVREERQPFAQPRVLGRDRLLDLQQQVGRLPHLVDAGDARADALVVRVRERASRAGAGLDDARRARG